MTAEKFLENWFNRKGYVAIDQADDIEESLIEFAKYHVEQALKEASKAALDKQNPDNRKYVSKKLIINSYPLTNIK